MSFYINSINIRVPESKIKDAAHIHCMMYSNRLQMWAKHSDDRAIMMN